VWAKSILGVFTAVQVLSCRSFCWVFFLVLAHPASTAWPEISCHYHGRFPRRARTSAKFRKETFVFFAQQAQSRARGPLVARL
jgi:hypothetical protein